MSSFPLRKLGRIVVLFVIAIGAIGSAFKAEADDMPKFAAKVAGKVIPTNGELLDDKSGENRKPRGIEGIAGIWNVFAAEVNGVNACSAAAHNGDRTIMFTMLEGNRKDVFVDLNSPTWDIPQGKMIDINIVFDKRTPLFLEAVVSDRKDVLHATASGPNGVAVLDGILNGAIMLVGFFDPTEPKWKISLKGSRDALAAQYFCMANWQRMSH